MCWSLRDSPLVHNQVTKAEFTALLTAEGYLPHEVESLWAHKPESLSEDEIDPQIALDTARDMLPRFLERRAEQGESAWD